MTSTAYKKITVAGEEREYVITMPSPYDMNKAYRFIYTSHGLGGEGNDIQRENYYSLKSLSDADGQAIYISPSGTPKGSRSGWGGTKDVALFDDLLALVKQNACVDTSRVFVLGFSFGGMYTYMLSGTRQKDIRAGLGLGPAMITIPSETRAPIAWMQTTGMSDTTCPWSGAKTIATKRATDNGCMLPAEIPTWKSGSPFCYDFEGCKPGYPVKVCTFNGGHGLMPGNADAMWKFITQF
jgi:poly(3-hydroxybutyrate) depolymerase